jgi:hypothetical protein
MLSQPKINLLRLMRSSSLSRLRSLTKIVFLKIFSFYDAVYDLLASISISLGPGGVGLIVPKPVFGSLMGGTNYKDYDFCLPYLFESSLTLHHRRAPALFIY